MWKLVPKNEAAELVPLCIKAGMPMLWAEEGGAFITLFGGMYERYAKHKFGRFLVWIGEGEPWYAGDSTSEHRYICDNHLDARQPDWRT